VLVGNSRCRTFEFVNNGGDGCFLLLTAEQWAATLQQHTHQQRQDSTTSTAAAPGSAAAAAHAADGIWDPNAAVASVRSGPFSVGPAYLDLPAGATGVLTIEYSPQQEGPQAAEYVLVCDNCTAHPLRVEGSGEQVQVELVGLDGRPWLPQDAQMQLWFGQVSPGMRNAKAPCCHTVTQCLWWPESPGSDAKKHTCPRCVSAMTDSSNTEFTACAGMYPTVCATS
jgi:hypothetical protein